MMIVKLLSGTMVIEGVRPGKQKKKNQCLLLAIHHVDGAWCMPGDGKKETEKLWKLQIVVLKLVKKSLQLKTFIDKDK